MRSDKLLLSFEQAKLDEGGLLTLRGWAAGTALVEAIEASVAEAPLGEVEYGRPRPDVAADHPEFVGVANCGFFFSTILDPELRLAREAAVSVRFAGGETRRAVLSIQRVLKAPAPDPDDGLLFNLDIADVFEDGEVYISGWAAHPDVVEAIALRLDGAPLGAAEFGRERADVGKSHPDLPSARTSGFRCRAKAFPPRPGETLVTLQVATRTGETLVRERIAGVKPAPVAAAAPRKDLEPASAPADPAPAPGPDDDLLFHLDVADVFEDGAVYVSGWAAHRNVVAAIELRLDAARLGAAQLGGERSDVGKAHPDLPSAATSGFKWQGKTSARPAGEARFTLLVSTQAGEVFVRDRATSVKAAPVAAAPKADDIRLVIDTPAIAGGALLEPVRRTLSIQGWAAAREGLSAIDVFLDGAPIGSAIRGLRRLDIGAAFPHWPDSLLAGYAIQLPRKLFAGNQHVLRLEARDRLGRTKEIELRVAIESPDEEDETNRLRARLSQAEIDLKNGLIAAGPLQPAFAVVLAPSGGSDFGEELARTLASLAEQAFPEFRTILSVPDSRAGAEAAETAARLRFALQIAASGAELDRAVASAADAWRKSEREPYFLRLRVGDRLGADALLEFALAIATRPQQNFVYADDRRLDRGRRRVAPFLKPEWSPDLLWSTNYIGRCWTAAWAVAERADISLSQAPPAGDYDLVLRLTEAARGIGRTPLVLAELAETGDSSQFERLALGKAMRRRGVAGGVRAAAAPGVYRARRRVTTKGLVSIVIPTIGARGLIETCIASLRDKTAYRRFEIVCVDNIRDPQSPWKPWLREHADRVVEDASPFNWSALNNAGARAASGEFLLFLNDDVEILESRWLHAMLEHAQREEVGVVGAKLLYPDRRVQHAGMFLIERNGRHAFRFAEEGEPGPFGLAAATREVAAVTGACMLMRREVFEAVGRYDEAHAIVNNDVDFCLRVGRAGKRVIYTPHARLIHHEMASRSELRDSFDESGFQSAWRITFARGDPFFHPALSREDGDYSPEREPTRVITAGRPLLARQDVRRILVQKLDHVGDFVTGLPAIRRLQQRFPQAEIHLLAPTASTGLALLAPEIENVIEFNFFHHVSQNGRLDSADEDWRDLEARLRSYRFDIAIDLRKHTETREILKRSGARLTAGFDLRGAFPWLDVALEWDGDAPYLPKRAQVSEDYVALAEAVSLACERERRFLDPPPAAEAAAVVARLANFVEQRSGLFDRPLIAVHPAAGNVLRQWPAGHFAELIDLLLEAFDVHVALIGASAETALAADVIRQVKGGERVWSLVGKTKLSDLPALFGATALFVGNNSGPHHIAAALGTPTVGVHSGVVSAREWGPLGPKAVALQREMSCGPCYLDTPARCSRGLACLKGLRASDVFRVCEQMLGAGMRRGG